MNHKPIIVVVMMFQVLVPSSWAGQLAGGPDDYLSKIDKQFQEKALQNALEYNRTGQRTNWTNPDSGNSGTVTPTLTFKNSSGQDCRRYHRSMRIGGREAVGEGTRCRDRKGNWTVPKSAYERQSYQPKTYHSHDRGPAIPFTLHLGYFYTD